MKRKSVAVECSEEFRALRHTLEHWKAVADGLEREVKALELAFDESQKHLGDALSSVAKANDGLVSLGKKLDSTIDERNSLRNQMVAFREIALAAVGVKP